jgi:DNA-3-methyladenine glycosylase II
MDIMIEPVPPFDLDLSARIFSEGDGRIRRYEAGRYWQVIRLNERLALATVRSTGTVDDPVIFVELEPDGGISGQEETAARTSIIKIFNLNLDLRPFYERVKVDEIMSRLSEALRGLHSPSTTSAFEALIDSIIEQQISLYAAWSVQRRLTEGFGDVLVLGERRYYAFPTPNRLASATIEELRACGLSRRKAEYIRDASRLVADGLDLEGLKVRKDEEIVEELRRIRGVGLWTAELTLVRGMQKFDAIPADDLGIRRAISHYYYDDRKISGAKARRTAEQWKGWRGLASFYLIMAERLKIEVNA